MLNLLYKLFFVYFCSCLCFPLSSCWDKSAQQRLSSVFLAQNTVTCDICSNLVFSAQSPDADKTQLSCSLSASAQMDLNSNFFHLEGTIDKSLDTLDLGVTDVESFYDPEHNQSYSRFGSQYSTTGENSGLGTLVRLPPELRLDENYIQNEESELIHGSICDIYVGTERSGPVEVPLYVFGTHTSFSLDDTPIQVRLAVDQTTSLPVQMNLTYLPEDDCCSFTLPDGTEYILSELTFEATYLHYGQPIDTTIPEGFRDLALMPEDAPSATSSTHTDTDISEQKDVYFIQSPTCGYQISTPEYMAPETISDSGASFYYFYSEEDFEIIEYNLWEDFSPQDAAAYTEALPQLLRQSGGYGDLTSSKVNTLTVDGKEVQYRTIRFQTADNDLLYDGILVYSWCIAPNGTDVLEVVIWEYNGSDQPTMIQPEEELCFAYHYATPASDH